METSTLATRDAQATPAPGHDERGRSLAVSAIVAFALTVGAGVITAYALGEHDHLWLVVGAAVLAVVIVTSAHRVAARVESRRAAGLVTVGAIGLVYVVTVLLLAPQWKQPSGPSRTLFLAARDPSLLVYQHASPGSSELTGKHAPAPLHGDRGYAFECEAQSADGGRWARLSSSGHWVPSSALRTASGSASISLPAC
jgi:hypothetical protein